MSEEEEEKEEKEEKEEEDVLCGERYMVCKCDIEVLEIVKTQRAT